MRPLISKNPVATIPHRSIPPRLPETPVPAIRGIRAYRSTRPDCASTAFRSAARVDAGIRVSSVAPLTIGRRIDVPTLFQRLADLGLSEPFLLRYILPRIVWLPVFRDKLRRLHVLRFPIEIKNLIFRSQKILRMPVTFQTPGHAMRLRVIDHRHVVYRAVAAETTDASIDVRAVIVKNIIRCAMDLHPLDGLARFPAHPHRLKLWIVLLHLAVAVHACLRGGRIRVRRDLDKTVAITAIDSQVRNVKIIRERDGLDRLIPHPRVLWRNVRPRASGQCRDNPESARQS